MLLRASDLQHNDKRTRIMRTMSVSQSGMHSGGLYSSVNDMNAVMLQSLFMNQLQLAVSLANCISASLFFVETTAPMIDDSLETGDKNDTDRDNGTNDDDGDDDDDDIGTYSYEYESSPELICSYESDRQHSPLNAVDVYTIADTGKPRY
jgi:hypothetical protein